MAKLMCTFYRKGVLVLIASIFFSILVFKKYVIGFSQLKNPYFNMNLTKGYNKNCN